MYLLALVCHQERKLIRRLGGGIRGFRSVYGVRCWDTESTDKSRGEYQEIQHMVKAEMLKAKQGSYDDFYASLGSKEGETHLYRFARWRDRDGKDMQQVWVKKNRDENVLTDKVLWKD